MKKLIKVILPPVVAFLIFAVLRKLGPFAEHPEGLAQIGNETVYGLIAYFRIFWPLLFVTALLTQVLIVLPLWHKILSGPKVRRIVFISVFLVCCILAGGISYIIWDDTTGRHHLVVIFLFMAAVQLTYWAIDFFILFLIE